MNPCCKKEWDSKCLCLKVGDRLEYHGSSEMRMGDWKEGIWHKKGVNGTVIKLHEGSRPRPDIKTEDFPEGLPGTDAWATFQINGDEKARLAISLQHLKDYKKMEE